MKVLILCGGKGSRLSEETLKIPKPMVKIGKFPILLHIVNYYFSYNIKEFIFALGYRYEIIENYFINEYPKIKKLTVTLKKKKNLKIINYSNGLKIYLLNTGLNTETGGRILRAKKLLFNEHFFYLTYGDGLANIDLYKATKLFLKYKSIGLITGVRPPARFGKIYFKGNLVKKFDEKNQLDVGWINGGYFVFNNKIFNFIKGDMTNFELYSLMKLAKQKKLIMMKHNKFWQCMDTLREKIILNKLYEKKNAPWLKKKLLF